MSTERMGTTGYNPNTSIYINGSNIIFNKANETDIKKIIKFVEEKINKYVKKIKESSVKSENIHNFEELCNRMFEENKKVKAEILPVLKTKSKQYKDFTRRIYFSLYYSVQSITGIDAINFDSNYSYNKSEIESIISKISNLPKIEVLSELKKSNIMIIGGNGAGKSSFISFLKQYYSNEMVILPAQKVLIYDSRTTELNTTKKTDIDNLQLQNMIEELQYSTLYIANSNIVLAFSKIITAIVNTTLSEQTDYLQKRKEETEKGNSNIEELTSLFDRITEIWSKLIPDIKLKIDPITKTIIPMDKKGNEYNINAMSDGEKSLLYYIGNILLANDYSYIVIDEPETHLNPAVYKKLWPLLEKEKSNCQFVFISHDIEFIKTKMNSDIIWMKKYEYKDNWSFQHIDNNQKLPLDLIVEIYGSKNKILFCEGKDSSDDYSIYNALFDNYTIIPAGSCRKVQEYVRTFNEQSTLHSNNAIGIIDYDNRTEPEIKELKKNNIYETRCNEIEMLLCDDKVIDIILNNYKEEDKEKKKKLYKKEFYKKIEKNKEKIALDYVKNSINYDLENYKINAKDINLVETELKKIADSTNYKEKYEEYIKYMDELIEKEDYDALLRICNLKKEIVDGLGNKLISDYRIQAKKIIETDLKDYVKEKYFPDIV